MIVPILTAYQESNLFTFFTNEIGFPVKSKFRTVPGTPYGIQENEGCW